MVIMNRYIIITPCKNEEKDLPNLIESLAKQSIIPELWTFVDDGSTDKTPEIIQDTKNKYKWVESVCLKVGPRDLTIHISEVIKTCFDFAKNFCKEHNIIYDYIVFLDADMVIQDKEFFEKLIIEFQKDEHLGIASGEIQYQNVRGKLQDTKFRHDTISGGEMMCRKECIEVLGGVPISHAWESVMRVKAILNGWKVKRFNEIKIIHSRETGSVEGLKRGYYLKGTTAYYLYLNPFVAVGKGIIYSHKRPHYLGIEFLFGYFNSWIRRKERTNDEQIRKYYYWHIINEIFQYYFNNKYGRT
ncbi:Glycosyl transferase family 2 [uncultured archaeon]|nr:Glycosyl transferase family 2 [uncultured archaeon]